jgi:quinol monooxygenase YgiN
MFTRIVTMTCKPGQAKQVCKNITDKILPLLKKQQGFLDEILLVSATDPNRVVGQSFWKSREEAERYHRDQFPKIREMMQEALTGAPVVETYDVDTSTTHHIMSGQAA